MDYFYISREDRRWPTRWLRTNLIVILAGVAVTSVIRGTRALMKTNNVVSSSDAPVEKVIVKNHATSVMPLLSVSGEAVADGSTEYATIPEGWRRTANGWEHTSNWLADDKPIEKWIVEQERREPVWIQRLLEIVRKTPPIAFAVLQLAAVSVVVVTTSKTRPVRSSLEGS